MADNTGRAVNQLVRNYKAGAYCEVVFCECLIEVAQRCPPAGLWALRPEDLRDAVIYWMLDPGCQGTYDPQLTSTEGFRRLCEFLAQQKTEH